ncbi:MAG: hypothetical protein ACM3VV_05840, partial [Deltaproteobacteria bacterium]
VFRIDPLPVRGYHKTCTVVLLSVLLYQILVYYNCKTNKVKSQSNQIYGRNITIDYIYWVVE